MFYFDFHILFLQYLFIDFIATNSYFVSFIGFWAKNLISEHQNVNKEIKNLMKIQVEKREMFVVYVVCIKQVQIIKSEYIPVADFRTSCKN